MHTLEIRPELTEREFEIAVRRLADSLHYGGDTSLFAGAGIDYAQSRPFADGDSVKDIDWKVTARTRRYYVKEYDALRSIPVFLAVDTSASMNFSSQAVSKYELAVHIAGGLGLSALSRISPVGIVACGDRSLRYAPSLTLQQIIQWLHQLRFRRFDEGTHVGRCIDVLSESLQCRSLVTVISDLHDPDAIRSIKRIAQHHDCVVIQVQDPAELGGLRGGVFRGREAETGRDFVWHGGSRLPLVPLDKEGRTTATSLATAGIDHLLLRTDKPFVPVLRQFLQQRASRWRGTR
jgi:uncharacterized protein (DUF58 family)